MKVLLVNGSPNGHGCTYTALKESRKHCAPRAWKQKCSTLAISPSAAVWAVAHAKSLANVCRRMW